MGHRKPGRPSKHVGLSTPANLKKAVDGDALRNLQTSEQVEEGSILPHSREADAPEDRSLRVFGTARGDDGKRPAPAVEATVPDVARGVEQAAELRLTDLLRKVGVETAERSAGGDLSDRPITNLEALARRLWLEALGTAMGSQRAREMIVERLEGKAVRGDKPATPDTALNEQLERNEIDIINSLTPKDS